MEPGVSSLILSVDAIRTSVDCLIVFKICLIVFSISLIEIKISRLQILFSPYRKNFPIREILISPEVMKNRPVLKVRKTGLVSNGGVRVSKPFLRPLIAKNVYKKSSSEISVRPSRCSFRAESME